MGLGLIMGCVEVTRMTDREATRDNAGNDQQNEVWPALPQSAWSDTCATLQLWLQMVGKVRMALTPPINHCWNVTLYPTIRGLSTMPMAHGLRMVQIDFDFVAHLLVIETSDGGRQAIKLEPMTVAEFYKLSLIHI